MLARTFCTSITIATFLSLSPQAWGAMQFSRSSDTIQVAGGDIALTNQATFEATIELSSTNYPNGFGAAIPDGSGLVFNSWASGVEDKVLTIYNGGVPGGLAYPNNQPGGVSGGTMTIGQWYDIAFVIDGSQERFYINGTEVGSNNTSLSINNAPGSNVSAVGAIFRDGSINESFLGDIQSLRISNVARYFGSSYAATLGDFSDDSSTKLLYDFDAAPAGGIVTDLSGNGHTGTVGAGFQGATSPTFVTVPEPTSVGLLALLIPVIMRRR